MVVHASQTQPLTPEKPQPAFEDLVAQHERRVYNVCYRLLSDTHAAEDAAQETFLTAWRELQRQRPVNLTWLLHVATNKCRDELRRRKRHPAGRFDPVTHGDSLPATDEAGPEAAALSSHAESVLIEAIARLPAPQRTCLVLADVEELSYEEVAGVTGSGLGTVKSRLFRARRRLRAILLAHRAHGAQG